MCLYLLMGLKAAKKNSCLAFLAVNLCVRLAKTVSMQLGVTLKPALWSGNDPRPQECAGERERERAAGCRLPPSYGSDEKEKKPTKNMFLFLASDEQHEPGKSKRTLQVCQSVQTGRKR